MARLTAAPVDSARHGQPILAGGFWERPRADLRRFWRERRIAFPSRTPRLAGGRLHRIRLGCETIFQTDRHVGDLQAIGGNHARKITEGSPESLAGARGAFPNGR